MYNTHWAQKRDSKTSCRYFGICTLSHLLFYWTSTTKVKPLTTVHRTLKCVISRVLHNGNLEKKCCNRTSEYLRETRENGPMLYSSAMSISSLLLSLLLFNAKEENKHSERNSIINSWNWLSARVWSGCRTPELFKRLKRSEVERCLTRWTAKQWSCTRWQIPKR